MGYNYIKSYLQLILFPLLLLTGLCITVCPIIVDTALRARRSRDIDIITTQLASADAYKYAAGELAQLSTPEEIKDRATEIYASTHSPIQYAHDCYSSWGYLSKIFIIVVIMSIVAVLLRLMF